MNLTLIAAMAKNRVIGRDNNLIWHLPRDLKFFKEQTKGHHVIMGRKTYESMMKPLKDRVNIVISRKESYEAEGCIIVHSLKKAIEKAEQDKRPFIIGGAEIYKQALPYATSILLTVIDQEFKGDVRFPEIDSIEWEEISRSHYEADEKNPYAMDFIEYSRKS